MKLISFTLIVLFLFTTSPGFSQKKEGKDSPKDPMSAETFSGLKFRSIGPALTSGRIVDFAVNPTNHSEYYVAVASGGVWKTVNAGTTYEPIFNGESSYSIGCITLDPNNPHVVWVGSGENNSQRSVSYGDGVYKSVDGGKSWKNVGLKRSEHIGKIVIDPRNSDIVYVAAQGPLWGPGGDRGLFKSTDGGATWDSVLYISKHTGVTDIAMDPRNPDVLYAASYQRRRHVWTLINGGPESAIYKSVDAGKTWNKLAGGLPGDDVGRIGLAISPVNPDMLFAIIELPNRKGGFYRSTDRGASWEKRNEYSSGSAQYYSEIIPDPKDIDRIYSMDVYLKVTDDGGKTFQNLGEKAKHVDNHAIWINPHNTNHYLVGCDGGIYESFDRAATWNFKANLPVTQFYRVSVDNALPFYNIYGGTQDNFTLGGPSRTVSISGIHNFDWFITTGGDGFETVVDPEDPNVVYSQSQYGGLVRHDKRSGETMGIKPQEGKGEPALRWNWDSPLIISPHSHTRLYYAANRVYRSDDRGNSWRAVSPDLTRQINRNTLPVMDKMWGIDAVAKNASTSPYGNIVSMSESPLKEGLIYIGTDDGLIQVTEDGGANWRKVERFPDVPEMTYVSRLEASQHDANTVYAAFENHKNADFLPYVLKSVDAGKSWTSIRSNLPENGPVYAIAEDHVDRNLLFVGTEFGVFFTGDGGKKWAQLKGGVPTIAVRDIAIQKRENDLVLGTFGRGFYILDNYAVLRGVSDELLSKEAHLFSTEEALMFIQSRPFALRDKGFLGESFYVGENQPPAATFTYHLKDALKTRKQKRQDIEKEALKKNQPAPFPTWDELRAEDAEEPPAVLLTITDEAGNVVRRLTGATSSGITRMNWDLRYAASTPTSLTGPDPADFFAEADQGPLAMPGTYKAAISKRVDGVTTEIAGPISFTTIILENTTLPVVDRRKLLDFQAKVADLQRAVEGAGRVVDEVKSRLTLIKKALLDAAGVPATLRTDVQRIEASLTEITRVLRGDRTLTSRAETVPPSIVDRVNSIVYDQWLSTSAPTGTHERAYEIAGEEFGPLLSRLKTLVEVDLKNLERAMENAGAPWTPGRFPEWKTR
ncbi:MAG: glycosyl hydrolase [Bacteroidota bacterium]